MRPVPGGMAGEGAMGGSGHAGGIGNSKTSAGSKSATVISVYAAKQKTIAKSGTS